MSHARPRMIPTNVSFEKIELRRLHERVERLFSALEEALESESSDYFDSFSPPADLCENEHLVVISVELPGVRSDQISLTVTAKEILIEGHKDHPNTPDRALSHFCCERQYGRFQRRIHLRWAINIKETMAELNDGILRITLPKLIDRRGKSVRIPIRSAD